MPLLVQLHILQLEHYSLTHLFRWWFKHPTTLFTTQKKPLIYTGKIKLILSTIILLYFLALSQNVFLFVFFLAFPLPLITVSLLLLYPFEYIKIYQTRRQIKTELSKYRKLTTIAITGSFGKTSTKNFLYHILSHYHFSLKSPESYNTLFSLAKVIKLELTRHHRFFIPEFAAYALGDIKKLATIIPPQYSIITGIGDQHLDRFGSLEKITQTKLELATATPDPKQVLINLDSCPHSNSYLSYSLKNPQADFFISSYQLTGSGITFTLVHKNQTYYFSTPLFGTSNLYNLTAAISMALLLKIPSTIIKKAVASLPQSPHRLELRPLTKATLIDNTYSSNTTGFTQIIDDLSTLKGKKAIVTPGIVELGHTSDSVHHQLGHAISSVFDTIILVGHTSRTTSLKKGIGLHPHLSYLANHHRYWSAVTKLSHTHRWILLENDLPDNYS